MPVPANLRELCGWVDDPARFAIAAALPTVSQAAPGLTVDPNRSCLLYKCYKDVWADYPDYPAQEIGDCVGHGFSRCVDLLQTIDCYLGDLDVDRVHRTAAEFIYGESRRQANFLGNHDGSFGSAAAKAMTTVGIIPYTTIGAGYSGARSREWGRTGPPAAMVSAASRWRLGAAALLRDNHDLLAAIQAGKPCAICSRHGFTTVRDARGFCRLFGSWGHCMWVGGYRSSPPGYLVLQSWGPLQPTGPLDLDQPSWSFWVHAHEMAVIIAEGDSFALSVTPRFGPRPMPAAWAA